MSVLKSYNDTSSLYLRIDPIYTYEDALDRFNSNKIISSTITKKFLQRLKEFSKIHNRNYAAKKNVFLNDIYLFLPENYNSQYLQGHILRFVTESLNALPYFSYVFKNDKGILELHIIVSERTYNNKQKLINIYEDHDVYIKPREDQKGMKFCKKTDKGAILQRKKGDLKKSYFSYFSLKNRMFSGNRKAFIRLTNALKERWISYFKPLGIVKVHNFIQGISIQKSKVKKNGKNTGRINWYWLRNINLYNNLKTQINDDLTILFEILYQTGFTETDEEFFKAWALANKYKELFKSQKRIYFNRCDRVEEYFKEIKNMWEKDFYNIMSLFQD